MNDPRKIWAVIIASVLPAMWTILAIADVHAQRTCSAAGELGWGLPLSVLTVIVPTALVGFIAGAASTSQKEVST